MVPPIVILSSPRIPLSLICTLLKQAKPHGKTEFLASREQTVEKDLKECPSWYPQRKGLDWSGWILSHQGRRRQALCAWRLHHVFAQFGGSRVWTTRPSLVKTLVTRFMPWARVKRPLWGREFEKGCSKSQYWPWDLTTVCVLHAVVFSVSQEQDHVFLSPQHGTWSGRVEVVRPQERGHWNMKQKGGLTNTNDRHKIHPDCLGGTLLWSLF